MTDRPDAPGPMLRRGPRPLLLHLTLAMLKSTGSNAGSPNSKPDWDNWNVVEEAVRASAAGGAPPPIDPGLIAGIAAYRRHPWSRDLLDPPHVWAEGGSRILDYRGVGDAPPHTSSSAQAGDPRLSVGAPRKAWVLGPSPRMTAGGNGPTVLFVPSLVNRAHVLDLMRGHSMLRFLAAHGLRPLLLDWGWPGTVERGFTLTDYIAGRLERAMEAAVALAGGKIVLAGYCMGGNLAVAAAERRPDLVSALALLATPWDFHAPEPDRARRAAACLPMLEPAMAFSGTLPIDALQTLFTLLDPFGVGDKFRAFAKLDPDSARALLFVAMEDWLNDGVPLVAGVARECLGGWYGANAPARGEWRIAGLPVNPARIAVPTFVAVPGRDRIVPPESARFLAAAIPGAVLHAPAAGHVGMVAGAGAEGALWRQLLRWLGGVG